MKFILQIILLTIIITSCGNEIDFVELPKDSILHDNGSKVWLIDEIINSSKNFAPSNVRKRSVIIFYSNYKCIMQPLDSLGNKVGKSGNFELSIDNTDLTINFNQEKWTFDVLKINHLEIILLPKDDSSFPYELRLKTFPEF